MEPAFPDLRLKVPCSDEGDFLARLAERVAQRGLRVPTEAPRPVGTPVTVALELRNGGTITGAGIVEGHVRIDGRPGVNVRILRFASAAAAPEHGRAATAAAGARTAPPGAMPAGEAALPAEDEPLGDVPFVDAVEDAIEDALAPQPPAGFGSTSVSGQIVAAVTRQTARAQRGAIAAAVAALLVGAAGIAAARWSPAGTDAAAAAHLEASDRLFAEGRLTGEGGALEHLLDAKRLRPGDAAVLERLSRVADLLEALAARAVERGDVAVAAVHLGWAERAAPDRASIRARLDALAKGTPAREPAARRGTAEARVAPR